MRLTLLNIIFAVILPLCSHTAFAQSAPNLGTASSFAAFTAIGAFDVTGSTVVTGDVGTNDGAFNGFPPGVLNGQIHVSPSSIAATAAANVNSAYTNLDGQAAGTVLTTLGGGQSLLPGTYTLGAAVEITGNLTLNGSGIYLFQIDGALSTAVGSTITLMGGASFCDIYWQVNGAVTLNSSSTFPGIILAHDAITLNGASLMGQALSTNGAIALNSSVIDIGVSTASVITANGPVSFCSGGSVILSGNVGGVWNTGATTASITATTSGDYYVTNTSDCGAAISSNTITVTVYPPPVCTISSSTISTGTELCAPASLTYEWSTGEITQCIVVSTTETFSVTITDGNGCESSCSYDHVVTLDCDPVIEAVADMTLSACNATLPVLTTTWSDGSAGGELTGVATLEGTVGCVETYLYTFSGMDDCGDVFSTQSTVQRTIDISLPTITAIADFQMEVCGQPWPDALTTSWSDNCSAGGMLTATAGAITPVDCGESRVYTFSVTDDCGNSAQSQVTVTRLFDETDPSIVNPADYVLPGCNTDWPDNVLAEWTDNCSEGGSLMGVPGEIMTTDCSQSRSYTFTVMDDCGNAASAVTTITRFIEPANPEIVPLDDFQIEECSGDWPELVTVWTSDCSVGGSVTGIAGEVSIDSCLQSRVYTFSVVDDCGSSASSTTVVTRIFDETLPVIEALADFQIEGCDQPWPAILTSTWSDNCSEGGTVTASEGPVTTNECGESRVYTFSVSDDCGNSAQSQVTVTRIFDETTPSILNPVDYILPGCNPEWPDSLSAVWTDNCSEGGSLTGLPGEIITDVCSESRSYTFSVMDECGNMASAVTIITRFTDAANPVIVPVPDFQIDSCDGDWPVLVTTWTSDCSGGGNVTGIAGEVSIEECLQSRVYTFLVNDDCGISDTATTVVTRIIDEAGPVFGPLKSLTVDCALFDSIPEPSVTDNCSFKLTFFDRSATDSCGTDTLIRTWVATDPCFNVSTVEQIIIVINKQSSVFQNLVEVMNLDCTDDMPEFSAEVFYDCTGSALEIQSITVTDIENPDETCVLSTAFGPGADWALWLPTHFSNGFSSSENFVFDSSGGTFDQFSNGTAHLYGTVINDVNPAESYVLDLWFQNKRDWTAWSALGHSYKDDAGFAAANGDLWTTWNYYEMANNLSTATGTGDLAGNELYFQHMPSSHLYGFQVGMNANNKNASYGMSGWFTYTIVIDGIATTGYGDINVDIECVIQAENACPHNTTYTINYLALDDCYNESTFSQLIVMNDTIGPEFIDFPADTTISCEEWPITVPDILTVDSCGGDVVMESSIDTTESDCDGTFTVTYTWIATDICENTSQATWTVTVIDSTPPVITACPVDAHYVCLAAVPVADTSLISATDNCGDVTIEHLIDKETGDECSGTILRTYRVYDECGNFTDCVQQITYGDTIAPVFVNPPGNMFVSCENIPSVEDVIATDNCGDANLTVVVSEVMFSGGCIGVIQRIYTATDACGNTATHEQYITLVDTLAPVLYNLPVDTTLECDEIIPEPADVTAADNCDGTVGVDFNETIVEGDSPEEYSIIRTWSASDTCLNSVSYTQVIRISDNTAPVFAMQNTTVSIDCDGLAKIPSPTATDNCDPNPTVTMSFSTVTGDCPNEWTEVYVWVATDSFGNSSNVSFTVNYIDTIAPVFTFVPPTMEVECGAVIPATTAEATDDCGDVTITSSDSDLQADDCAGHYIRTFTAVDACGNERSATQLITIIDTTPPTITAFPADANYLCLSDIPVVDSTLVSATDNCSGISIVLFSELANGDACSGTVLRTYRAYDECGNFSDSVQKITYNDTIAPVFINPPQNMFASCENIPSTDDVLATDNCGDTIMVSVNQILLSGGCVGVFQRIYTATDACGNTATHEQYITLVDTIAPDLANLPADTTLECHDVIPDPADVTATDNCDDTVAIVFSENMIAGESPQEYTILRTWSATDICENTVSYTQEIRVSDNTPPEFAMENTVISIDCDGIAKIPNPVATDNCDPNPTVTMTISMSEGNCPGEWTEVYVWVATDSFGNSSNVSLTIHYTDTIAPVFTSVPATMEVACGADIPASTAEATDNCGNVTVTSSDGTLQTGDCEDHYIRTFTAVDECGNSSTATQRINIIDTVPPVFTQTIADIVVECAANAPAIAVVTATDNCGSVDIQSESIVLSSDSCGNYVEQVTYTAMDACGNIATQSYTITVSDTTAPVLSETPDSLILDCLDSLPVAPVITALSICQDSISVNYSEQFFGDAPTPGSIADCNLSTAPNTNPSWALWLQDLPVGYNYYISESAKLVEFPDGTAHLTGTVVSASNPDAGWIIDVWYMDGMNWDDWSNQDAQTGFKDDAGLAGNNYLNWTFYITNGDSSTLTGTGDLAGSFLNLRHEPASRFYAFQVGVAANNFSAGYGMGGWFHYEGTFQNSALPSHEEGVIENGVGDFAFEGDCCPIYNVHRTWTATDCAGNSTSWTQNISFTDLPETAAFVEIPEAPNFNIPRNFMAISNIYPNPSRGLTTVEFISQFDLPVTLEIYNVVNKNTARLFAGDAKAGLVNRVDFDGSDMHSGIYFIRLISGTEIFLEKFIIQQ